MNRLIKEITHYKTTTYRFFTVYHNRSITLYIVNKIKILFPNSVIVLGGLCNIS
jgi:hypothetical protein